jgi:hypothetical protein
MKRRAVRMPGHGWQELPRHSVLAVRHPRLPSGAPWPQADVIVWEKTSRRRVRQREGVVYIKMPGGWWAHGELLHYAHFWDAMHRWVQVQSSEPDGLWKGQRVQLILALVT